MISPTRVLTAAHCVKGAKVHSLRILEGSAWSRGKRAGRVVRVSRVRIHPRYNPEKDGRDLAVL